MYNLVFYSFPLICCLQLKGFLTALEAKLNAHAVPHPKCLAGCIKMPVVCGEAAL